LLYFITRVYANEEQYKKTITNSVKTKVEAL
jgi:hypothetical protein